MAKVKRDQYTNVAYASCLMSAADTLSFELVQFAVGIFQGVGILIHRVLYYPVGSSLRQIVAASDSLTIALTTSNRLTSIDDVTEPAVIDRQAIIGIGAGVEPVYLPMISDWTNLPGGGKIFPANPLYLGVTTAGFTSAAKVFVEIQFTFVELADKDYIELIQSQLPANIG